MDFTLSHHLTLLTESLSSPLSLRPSLLHSSKVSHGPIPEKSKASSYSQIWKIETASAISTTPAPSTSRPVGLCRPLLCLPRRPPRRRCLLLESGTNRKKWGLDFLISFGRGEGSRRRQRGEREWASVEVWVYMAAFGSRVADEREKSGGRWRET